MNTTVQPLKGFRDFLPADSIKRQFVISKIKESFQLFGFDPLETPALEYAQTLLGKYGDEADKLLYLFEDRGGRKVGMRYDQTVPASRVVSQYVDLPRPFKRYQIQPVWRAENPQRGRFREFLQCDADIYGTDSYLADAELIALLGHTLKHLGFNKFSILVNDRTLFGDIPNAAIGVIDKLNKIGAEGVRKELQEKGFDPAILDTVKNNKPTEQLQKIVNAVHEFGLDNHTVKFDPTLARGLDYYTSTIMEVIIDGYDAGSVAGGGRYDKLLGQFTGKDISAVGFAFGFDRLLEAMEQKQLLPVIATNTQVLVTVFYEELTPRSLAITTKLRESGINAEISFDASKLDKQLKYADKKCIPYVIVLGPDEASRNTVQLKNMKTKEKEELSIDKVIQKLTK